MAVEIEAVETLAETDPVWFGRPRPFEFLRSRSRAGDNGFRRPLRHLSDYILVPHRRSALFGICLPLRFRPLFSPPERLLRPSGEVVNRAESADSTEVL